MKNPNKGDSSSSWRSAGQFAVVGVVLVLAIAVGRRLRPIETQEQQISEVAVPSDIAAAVPLYVTYCTKCHGPEGHGDPESIARLTPPPRDFASSDWRFARTKSKIRQVIRDGIPGTAMPGMGHVLSDEQSVLLADFVLHLSTSSGGSSQPEFKSGFQKDLADLGFTVFAVPQAAPTMKLTDAAGNAFQSGITNGKLVLLNFWGTTCTHCLAGMRHLMRLKEELGGEKLVILNICADEDDPEVIRAAINEVVADEQVYIDDTGLLAQRYSVSSLPTYVVVDAHGRAVARASGSIDWSQESTREAVHRLVWGLE